MFRIKLVILSIVKSSIGVYHIRLIKKKEKEKKIENKFSTFFSHGCFEFVLIRWKRVNDPSAGSPTETLLRLLLPLDAQVCFISHLPEAANRDLL